MLILNRSLALCSTVAGDAPVAEGSRSAGSVTSRALAAPRPPAEPLAARPKKKARGVHNVSNGVFTTNRTGAPLCADFQRGACQGVSNGIQCPRDSSKVHLCEKCLGQHPGSSCTNTPRPNSASRAAGRGRGANKGGGKGKRGKGKNRAQY